MRTAIMRAARVPAGALRRPRAAHRARREMLERNKQNWPKQSDMVGTDGQQPRWAIRPDVRDTGRPHAGDDVTSSVKDNGSRTSQHCGRTGYNFKITPERRRRIGSTSNRVRSKFVRRGDGRQPTCFSRITRAGMARTTRCTARAQKPAAASYVWREGRSKLLQTPSTGASGEMCGSKVVEPGDLLIRTEHRSQS